MKKLLIAALAVFALTTANAQEQGKVRVGLDIGAAIPDGGGGILFNLEPKYNIADNMNVGLRYSLAATAKNVQTDGTGDVVQASISASASYMATYDYYFVLGGAFNPFVGAGLGYVSLANVSFQDGDNTDGFGNDDVSVAGKFGAMIRGGFEASKFRFTVEYDIISKTGLENINGDKIGEIKNSYLGITAGFYVGGGRW